MMFADAWCKARGMYLLRGICINTKSHNYHLILGLNYAYIFPPVVGTYTHPTLTVSLLDTSMQYKCNTPTLLDDLIMLQLFPLWKECGGFIVTQCQIVHGWI